MILQQYYTRERRGIFRSTEGYDTIAKSPSLDNNLIKKVFHSYCFYNPPRELQVAGEKDGEQYPEALTFLQMDTKESMLGQSVYVPVDFTGQRSTFFTHNYLIPQRIKEGLIKSPDQLLYVSEFKRDYDIEQGVDLPELEALAYTKQLYNENFTKDLFDKLGIGEEIFKSLLVAISVSVTSRKKIYIALDVEATDISTHSKALLLCLLESLPYEMRRVIGFISYLQKPESKKNINIMFVDKESIKHGVSGIEQDFMFDFSSKRFPSLETSNNAYLDFVWTNRGKKEITRPFYEFVDDVLEQANVQELGGIWAYHELAIIYQVMMGNSDLYGLYKNHIFDYMLNYIDSNKSDKHLTLNNLATRLIKEELELVSSKGLWISLDFAKHLIPYYDLASQENKANISRLFLFSLINAKTQKQEVYFKTIFELIGENTGLIKKVVNQMMENPSIKERLLKDYLRLSLGKPTTIKQWIKEIERLREISAKIIEDAFFQLASMESLVAILKRQSNIVISSKMAYEYLDNFTRSSSVDTKTSDIQYVDYLESQLDQLVLASISIESITKDELSNLRVSQTNASPKVKTLYILKDFVMANKESSRREIKGLIKGASELEAKALKSGIKNLVMDLQGKAFYEGLILAFYKGEVYDYEPLLNFIYRERGKETVYDFIHWSTKRKEFISSKRTDFNRDYAVAMTSYFINLDPQAFKDREVKKGFLSIEEPGMQRVFKRINEQLATGFERIRIKHGKKIVRITGGLMLMSILLTGLALGAMKVREIVEAKQEIERAATQKKLDEQKAAQEAAKKAMEEREAKEAKEKAEEDQELMDQPGELVPEALEDKPVMDKKQ